MNDWQKRITSSSERPVRVEVRAALGAADRHPRERVLEHLLEPEELDDARAFTEGARGNALTLVYAARDTEHNDAVVLAEVLRRGLPRRSGSG